MALNDAEMSKENSYLVETSNEIKRQLEELGKEIHIGEEQINEFRKYLWEEKGNMDSVELQTSMMSSELEAGFMISKMEYYRKLFRTQKEPYFGRVDFKEDGYDEIQKIYVGLTHIEKDFNYYVHDWRSPIASLFYDCKVGKTKYEAPGGEIEGEMFLKRQYKIENQKLIRVFDSNLNVDDECLQEVLANQSSEKMKNIVNTIQEEQNEIIRNITNKNLIVQGIAGSGKTSVALHRIAFLLYKIKNLKSNNILIFSPNNVFTEYISNVLPELGEDNAMGTTFHDFAKTYIKEFKQVQTFTNFIEKYYTKEEKNIDLVKFKLSNKMIKVIEEYVKQLEKSIHFTGPIETNLEDIDKEYLDYLIKERYNKLPLFERIDKISEHICNKLRQSVGKYKRTYIKKLKELLSIKEDYKELYKKMYQSDAFERAFGKKIMLNLNDKEINYEDSLNFIYLKGLLKGFPYSSNIKQIVIDEAQDYNELQYIILSKIFKTASFTILGDVNQTINPYQKYDSLEVLCDIINENTKYLELTKTYRSSSEIIEYTNKILGLNHISAIRKPNNVPVQLRYNDNTLIDDINNMRNKYKSLAIITKNKEESIRLYNSLKDKVKDISIMEDTNQSFNRDFVIVPSYLAKGLEFDSVISYTTKENPYTKEEKYLFYVVATRCQHELIIYNPSESLI